MRTVARFRVRTASLLLPLALVSCGDGSGPTDPARVVEVLISPPESTVVPVGGTIRLQASALNGFGDPVPGSVIDWRSLNESVATVNSEGEVRGIGNGSAEITARAGARTGSITVTVEPGSPPPAPSNLAGSAATNSRIDLTWIDHAAGENVVRVERGGPVAGSPDAVGAEPPFDEIAEVSSGVTTYSDTGLDPGSTYHYRVRACGPFGCSAYTETVAVPTHATLVITTDVLPMGQVDVPYQGALAAIGGTGGYSWSLVGGTLPDGLELTSTGEITGTPSGAGSTSIEVRAQSGDGQVATRDLMVEILPSLRILTVDLPDGALDEPYDADLMAAGGALPYSWSLVGGGLPPGLSLEAQTGRIHGVPTQSGSFQLVVRVASSNGEETDGALEISILAGPVLVTTVGLPDGTLGTPYAQTLTAVGGDGEDYTWSVDDGELPTGLSLDPTTGGISGTPSETGTFEFGVRATSGGASGVRDLAIRIGWAPVLLDTRAVAGGYVGVEYSFPLAVQGGDGEDYTFTIVSGSLPQGLSLESTTGRIGGVPQAGGTSSFRIQVQNGGMSNAADLNLTVSNNPPEGFNIWTHNRVQVSSAVQAHIDEALARWEEIIAGDAQPGWVPPSACGGMGAQASGLFVDDLFLIVDTYFDAVGGVLATAGPCAVHAGSPGLPYVGIVRLDLADANRLTGTPALTDIVLHEIAHVLGVGTRWAAFGYLQNPACSPLPCDPTRSPPPSYHGPTAVGAYEALGGTGAVPVENDGPLGAADAHWEWDDFGRELMTRFIYTDGGPNHLSRVTLGAVIDLGWPGVDLGAADAFSLPGGPDPAPPRVSPEPLQEEFFEGPIHILLPDGSFRIVSGAGF